MNDTASWITTSMSRMDDDEAQMFGEFLVYEVLGADIENNRRTLNRHIEDVHKSLLRDVTDKDVRELVSLVAKAQWNTPYEKEEHKKQPRNAGGRWSTFSINVERGKNKAPKYDGHVDYEKDTIRTGDFDLTSALRGAKKEGSAFAERWDSRDEDQSTNSRTYRRIAAGSRLLGNVPNSHVQAASLVGQFVGDFGPEAERVIGPAARRTAYRYRGTERAPDAALSQLGRDSSNAVARNEGIGSDKLTPEMKMTASERAAVGYLVKRLPSKHLMDLQLQSGKVPPSEGIIINADGDIATQAVGFNEDHYLPFNLKSLKGLKGGAYVRTRSSGGLTAEDIYTGLVGGARSVTVVSRSGVFTLDFNDDLRGGRRYSDKARQMVGRYAHTLDAVQSETVVRDKLSGDERAEIRRQVEEDNEGMGLTHTELEAKVSAEEKNFLGTNNLTNAEYKGINDQAKELADSYTPGVHGQSYGGQGTKNDKHWRSLSSYNSVPKDPEARLRYFKSELIDQAMEEKSKRKYRLDAEGYKVSMDALREQFPYFIDEARYIPFKGGEGFDRQASEVDRAYVRPGAVRPNAARSGYFKSTEKGQGKFAADELNLTRVKKPDEVKEGEEAAVAAKKMNPKEMVARNVAENIWNDASKAAVGFILPQLDETMLPRAEYPQLYAAKDRKGELPNTWKDKDALQAEFEKIISRFEDDKNFVSDIRSQPYYTNMKSAVMLATEAYGGITARTPFDQAQWNPAVVPSTPRRFGEGAESTPGNANPEVYRKAWERAHGKLKANGYDVLVTPESSDADYRASLKTLGDANVAVNDYASGKTTDTAALSSALMNLYRAMGISEDGLARRAIGHVTLASADPKAIAPLGRTLNEANLALVELRSIKANAGDALTAKVEAVEPYATVTSTASPSVASTATPKTVTETKARKTVLETLQELAGNEGYGKKERAKLSILATAVKSGDEDDINDALQHFNDRDKAMWIDALSAEGDERKRRSS